MSPENQQKLDELYAFMQAMKNSSSIPLEVDSAFRGRFSDITGLTSSSKAAGSEDKTVDEGGASTYNVLKPPDGFDKRQDGATTKYYPYYT